MFDDVVDGLGHEVLDIDTLIDVGLLSHRKEIVEKKRQAASHVTKIEAGFARGDLEEVSRSLGRLEAASLRMAELAGAVNQKLGAYPVEEYLSCNFHDTFMAVCKAEGLTVEGSFPRYEVFPFRVRVLVSSKSIEVNERKVRMLRPKALAQYLSKQKSKLEAASFNTQRFVDALARAYDLLISQRESGFGAKLRQGLDLPLMAVYEVLTLLPPHRRAYPAGMFAFDLHRLFVSDCFSASDGRTLVLGDARTRGQRVVTYDASGREHRFGSIRFEAAASDCEARQEGLGSEEK